jgi:hypothetical protein
VKEKEKEKENGDVGDGKRLKVGKEFSCFGRRR